LRHNAFIPDLDFVLPADFFQTNIAPGYAHRLFHELIKFFHGNYTVKVFNGQTLHQGIDSIGSPFGKAPKFDVPTLIS